MIKARVTFPQLYPVGSPGEHYNGRQGHYYREETQSRVILAATRDAKRMHGVTLLDIQWDEIGEPERIEI